jgi:hypothetical protein
MTEAPEIASLRENGQRGDCANAGKRLEALKVRVAGEEFLGAVIQVIPLMIQFQVSGQLQPEGLDSRRIQRHRKTDAFEFGLLGDLATHQIPRLSDEGIAIKGTNRIGAGVGKRRRKRMNHSDLVEYQ